MPAKKKINKESKTTEINVKGDMKRCKQVEEKLNECIDISDEDETETNGSNETKQSISKSLIQRINTIILLIVPKHMCQNLKNMKE